MNKKINLISKSFINPVILYKGSGKRNYSLLRKSFLKQKSSFILENNKSLRQEKCEMIIKIENIMNTTLACKKENKFIATEQIKKKNIQLS